MGYTTNFAGTFTLDVSLTEAQANYLNAFAATRRMRRNPSVAATLPDPLRAAVGLPIGVDAGYFVGGSSTFGQDKDASVLDYNRPPHGQPGLWCKWVVNPKKERGDATGLNQDIGWSGVEKFYDYVEWLQYLIDHFLKPWGRTLNGQVEWQGERDDDRGMIIVSNNVVTTNRNLAGSGTLPRN